MTINPRFVDRRQYGQLAAIGHLNGQRYEDWRSAKGVFTRVWEDGKVEVLPEEDKP